MIFKLGLTGSIGMGKSTTAKMFSDAGCAVWDADAAVHDLYGANGAAVDPIGALLPEAIIDRAVSREVLKTAIGAQPDILVEIEKIVHPLVADHRSAFLAGIETDIAVFDIPLLFETGGHVAMDAVAVVWVDADTQRQRVMARGSMSEAQFELILAKQMPIEEKKSRADYLIHTATLEGARTEVHSVIDDIKRQATDANT